MYEILVSVGVPDDIAYIADAYATATKLTRQQKNQLSCCVVKEYGNYSQLERQYPDVVQDCSPTADCATILRNAGLG